MKLFICLFISLLSFSASAARFDQTPPEFINVSPISGSQLKATSVLSFEAKDNALVVKVEALVNGDHTVVLWEGRSHSVTYSENVYVLGMSSEPYQHVVLTVIDQAGNKQSIELDYHY